MIEVLKQQLTVEMSAEEKINRVREFLQIITLKIIYDKGYFKNLAFVGGTALRILYNLRRFSEDLDFSLINSDNYNFSNIDSCIKHELYLNGFKVETKLKESKVVGNINLKFIGLLKELELSNLDDQKLSIKIEVDTNPPEGWHIEDTFINKIYLFNLTHFNLPSLYATKLHACFFRKYIKGRDFYDLIWYIGKKVTPNYCLLNNAIKQTEDCNLDLNEESFKDFVLEKVKAVDFKLIRKDVERFLEDKEEAKLLNLKTIENSLK